MGRTEKFQLVIGIFAGDNTQLEKGAFNKIAAALDAFIWCSDNDIKVAIDQKLVLPCHIGQQPIDIVYAYLISRVGNSGMPLLL